LVDFGPWFVHRRFCRWARETFKNAAVSSTRRNSGAAGAGGYCTGVLPWGCYGCREELLDASILAGDNPRQGCAGLRRHCPTVKVIILSMPDDEDSVVSAIRSGARAFVPKKASFTELLDALRTVARGGSYRARRFPTVCWPAFSAAIWIPMTAARSSTKDPARPPCSRPRRIRYACCRRNRSAFRG
jgi:hypothetical protein